MMGTVTYPDPSVIGYINRLFVPWQVNYGEASSLLRRFNVFWTPQALILDEHGREFFRVIGYLPPEVFLAYLSAGLAHMAFALHQYREAAAGFDAVVRDFPHTCKAPEAVYYRAICLHKTDDREDYLGQAADILERDYDDSDWALRAEPWVRAGVGAQP